MLIEFENGKKGGGGEWKEGWKGREWMAIRSCTNAFVNSRVLISFNLFRWWPNSSWINREKTFDFHLTHSNSFSRVSLTIRNEKHRVVSVRSIFNRLFFFLFFSFYFLFFHNFYSGQLDVRKYRMETIIEGKTSAVSILDLEWTINLKSPIEIFNLKCIFLRS